MASVQRTATPSRPWHLWLVGIVGGLWGVVGVVSFVLTQLDVEAVMGRFPPEQRAYFISWPLWADAFWALGVVSGLIGSVLLLRRNRLALPAFLASVVGTSVSSLGGLGLLGGMEVMTQTGGLGATVFPVVVAAVLAIYAGAMSRKGVLG